MKLISTYTKKVPGREDFSSEGFGATIEVEVSEPQAQDAANVQQWLRELYSQAKQAVEEQIQSVPRRSHMAASGLFGRPNGDQSTGRSPGNGQGVATPKQVSYLISLGNRNKLTYADLLQVAKERFDAEDLYQLSKAAASQMIDELKPNS